MKGVVDGAYAVRLRLPGVKAGEHRLALFLYGEVDDHCRAAPGGRPRAGLEGVGGRRTSEGHLHVGVGVNAARENVFACGVNHELGSI